MANKKTLAKGKRESRNKLKRLYRPFSMLFSNSKLKKRRPEGGCACRYKGK